MYSSASRFAARAAVSGLRLRTVMENALSPSAWTSASARNAVTASSMLFSRSLG